MLIMKKDQVNIYYVALPHLHNVVNLFLGSQCFGVI